MFDDRARVGYVRMIGDRLAHEFIVAHLADARPHDGVLSEEGHDDRARLQRERVWIVDPLDGSNDYAHPWSGEWAVHVALCVDGHPVAGAVSLPAIREIYATEPAPSLPTPGVPDRRERLLAVVSRSRANVDGYRLQRALGADVGALGSAGVKAMLVVRGDADVYVHGGGLYEWDVCAPIAVAGAAGLHVSGIDGRPLRFNASDPWVQGFVVCRPELADPVLAALA